VNRKLTTIELRRVEFIPKDLQPGLLYVSDRFRLAVHLCACGCGRKVTTPLKPTEWALSSTDAGPSLHPSIGSWQLPCQSHYWIAGGEVVLSTQWTSQQIAAGRRSEEARREAYYSELNRNSGGWLRRFRKWIMGFLGR
jgi:hypothetical protein